MKRVLCVGNNYYPKGGSDRYLINLTRLLSKMGHDAIPFSTKHKLNRASQWSSNFTEPTSTEGFNPADGINLLHSKAARKKINGLLAQEKIDIAHLNIYSQLTSSILSPLKKMGIPIVQTLHDYKPLCATYSLYNNGKVCELCGTGSDWNVIGQKCNRDSYLRSFASFAENRFTQSRGSTKSIDHFITVCEFQRQKFLEFNTLPAESMTTIPNFVDTEYFTTPETQGDYLLYFGRVEESKGLYTLVKAMAPLKNLRLVIAGEGMIKSELQTYVTQRKLNHISFQPHTQHQPLQDLIAGSLCTVLPSKLYELCPMSILESFALKKMVIGANNGGIPELIQDGQNGLLFSPGDENELRDKIVMAFDKRKDTRARGIEGRRTVEEKYNIHRHYESLMQVYSRLS